MLTRPSPCIVYWVLSESIWLRKGATPNELSLLCEPRSQRKERGAGSCGAASSGAAGSGAAGSGAAGSGAADSVAAGAGSGWSCCKPRSDLATVSASSRRSRATRCVDEPCSRELNFKTYLARPSSYSAHLQTSPPLAWRSPLRSSGIDATMALSYTQIASPWLCNRPRRRSRWL